MVEKLRVWGPLALVLMVATALRANVYSHVTGTPLYSQNIALYFDALRNHLGEYVFVNTLKPPLTYLIHSGVVKLFSDEALFTSNVLLIVTYLMGLAAVVLLYVTAERLKVNRYLTASVLLFYSLAYVPLEQWWKGAHYDHHTLFFTSLFVYSIVWFGIKRAPGSLALLCASGALMVAQSTVNSLVATGTMGLVVLLSGFRSGTPWEQIGRNLAIAITVPAVVVLGLVGKNYAVAGVPATSNLGGMATIMVVARGVGLDLDKLREIIVRSDVPDWYLWCYDNATQPTDPDGVPYPGWELHSRESGTCYPWTRIGSESWPHDFRPLRDKLEELGEQELVEIVEADIADARDRQYLFAGFSPDSSPRWIAQYGSVSLKVFRRFIMEDPTTYLAVVRNLNYHFRLGPGYPAIIQGPDGREHPEMFHLRSLYRYIGGVYAFIVRTAYILLFIGWIYVAAVVTPTLRRGVGMFVEELRRLTRRDGLFVFATLSAPALLLTAIFSSQVGGENHRYYYQITPYLVIVFLLFGNWVLQRIATLGARNTV